MLLVGCSSPGPAQPGVTYARYQFSCCLASEIGQVWSPGQTVQLHWIVQSATATPDSTPHNLVLTANLAGPYKDVVTLKSLRPAQRTITTASININDRTPATPISVFVLPSDLAPGLYSLTIKVDFGGGNRMDAGSIVQVGSH
jgi:hypothetical protein